MTPDERLNALGLTLPEIPPTPFKPRLTPVRVHRDVAFVSGIGPVGVQGVVGLDVSVEQGYQAARTTALLAFRQIVDALASSTASPRGLRSSASSGPLRGLVISRAS